MCIRDRQPSALPACQKKDFLNGADFANRGYDIGAGLADSISNPFAGFAPKDKEGIDYSQFATDGSPATVKGKGKNGAVKVCLLYTS